jgi:hypothetical protein
MEYRKGSLYPHIGGCYIPSGGRGYIRLGSAEKDHGAIRKGALLLSLNAVVPRREHQV